MPLHKSELTDVVLDQHDVFGGGNVGVNRYWYDIEAQPAHARQDRFGVVAHMASKNARHPEGARGPLHSLIRRKERAGTIGGDRLMDGPKPVRQVFSRWRSGNVSWASADKSPSNT